MRTVLMLMLMLAMPLARGTEPLPLFDAHVHYSQDAWERVPPKDAIAILRKAGVKRALVSSSNDDGNQKLYTEAPDIILPSLRPYRSRGDIGTWMRDDGVATYLEQRLKKYRYVAIGEFHVYGADADAPERRHYVGEHANWSRGWLAELPPDVAERIAYRNGETIFGNLLKP